MKRICRDHPGTVPSVSSAIPHDCQVDVTTSVCAIPSRKHPQSLQNRAEFFLGLAAGLTAKKPRVRSTAPWAKSRKAKKQRIIKSSGCAKARESKPSKTSPRLTVQAVPPIPKARTPPDLFRRAARFRLAQEAIPISTFSKGSQDKSNPTSHQRPNVPPPKLEAFAFLKRGSYLASTDCRKKCSRPHFSFTRLRKGSRGPLVRTHRSNENLGQHGETSTFRDPAPADGASWHAGRVREPCRSSP